MPQYVAIVGIFFITRNGYDYRIISGASMSIKENLEQVKQNIASAAMKTGKRPEDITLVMATKTIAPERIREAILAGGHIIGENKV